MFKSQCHSKDSKWDRDDSDWGCYGHKEEKNCWEPREKYEECYDKKNDCDDYDKWDCDDKYSKCDDDKYGCDDSYDYSS